MKKIFKNAVNTCLHERTDHWIEHHERCSGLNMKCACVCTLVHVCGVYFVCMCGVCGICFVCVYVCVLLCVCLEWLQKEKVEKS